MRNRKTFLERSQSLSIRKITELFQWEQYQLLHIAFWYYTQENLHIQKNFFLFPKSPEQVLKYQVPFYWLKENFLSLSDLIQYMNSGKAFSQEINKRRHCPTVPHLMSSWKSPISQKCKFTATPPISEAKPFVWIEPVWIQLVLLMQENSFVAKNSHLNQICQPRVGE